jgi:hypothetical protein
VSEALGPRIATWPAGTTAKQRRTTTRLCQLLRAEVYAVGVVKEEVAEWNR